MYFIDKLFEINGRELPSLGLLHETKDLRTKLRLIYL